MHTELDEIGMTDDELAAALGRPERTKATVLVDDLVARSERRQRAGAVTRLGG